MLRLCLFLVPALALAQNVTFHNGKVVTVDPAMTVHEAVAVRDGRIVAVGPSSELIEQAQADGVALLDLEGRTVLPGLIDSHVHALSAGLSEFRESLPPLDSFAAIQSYIREQAEKTPAGEWIVVPRTFPTRLSEMEMPTREVLDVTTDHPVMFDASYTVVVNSKALEMSKITRYTAHPPGGEIVVDSNGDPNGILKNARGLLVDGPSESSEFSKEEKLEALEAMLRRYRDAGLTAVGDRAVNAEQIELYRRLHGLGRLPLRVVMTWRPGAAKNFAEILYDLRESDFTTGTGDSLLKFGAYKVTLDGGMTIGTAYQRHPYGEFGKRLYGMTNPDDVGMRFVGPEKLLAIFRKAREKGWQLTAHSQGGGAVDTFLDVMAELDRDRPIAEERHHLMHASFESPEALARASKMGVMADVQMPWLYHDGAALEQVMGWEGMRWFIPLRSYLEAGVKIAGGSDHMIGFDKNTAVNPYNPFFQIWMAVTRARANTTPLYADEESISREDALRMHTIWAAEMQHAEQERGSIEVGKLADFVVIDEDFLEVPVEKLREIEPVMTILEGKTVYRRWQN